MEVANKLDDKLETSALNEAISNLKDFIFEELSKKMSNAELKANTSQIKKKVFNIVKHHFIIN